MCRKSLRVNENQPQTTELTLTCLWHVPVGALENLNFFIADIRMTGFYWQRKII